MWLKDKAHKPGRLCVVRQGNVGGGFLEIHCKFQPQALYKSGMIRCRHWIQDYGYICVAKLLQLSYGGVGALAKGESVPIPTPSLNKQWCRTHSLPTASLRGAVLSETQTFAKSIAVHHQHAPKSKTIWSKYYYRVMIISHLLPPAS